MARNKTVANKGGALHKYCLAKLGCGAKLNTSIYELTCDALALDGFVRPSGIKWRSWVVTHEEYIQSFVRNNASEIAAKKANRKEARLSARAARTAQVRSDLMASLGVGQLNRGEQKQSNGYRPKPLKTDAAFICSDAFLKSFEWRALRLEVLKRDGRRCACCGASPETGAVMNVDHIKPRKHYPELALDPSNLQILCSECNHGKGNWDQTDFRSRIDCAS